MRQVFSSPRLENVEGIARFLSEHGIEVRITQGRSYKGGWNGRRSYRDAEGGPMPAVWVVKSEDQPHARQLLREAGLLDSTRQPADSYLAPSVHEAAEPRAATPQRRAFRYKLGLLAAIGVAVALAYGVMRRPSAPAPARTPAATAPSRTPPAAPKALYHYDTPPALAETLVRAELGAHDAREACLAVDGRPADEALVVALRQPGMAIAPCAPAADAPLAIEIGNYLTDGSGQGTVELAVSSPDPAGRRTTQIRTLQVRREGGAWRVLRVLSVR